MKGDGRAAGLGALHADSGKDGGLKMASSEPPAPPRTFSGNFSLARRGRRDGGMDVLNVMKTDGERVKVR